MRHNRVFLWVDKHLMWLLRPLVYGILTLGAVAILFVRVGDLTIERTLPRSGVTRICRQGDRLLTSVSYLQVAFGAEPKREILNRVYVSTDGGFSWRERDQPVPTRLTSCSDLEGALNVSVNWMVRYQWEPGETIERTDNGGQIWVVDNALHELRREVRLYLRDPDRSEARPGPFGAVVHEITGNIIFAMGWDGVLVRTPDGDYYWGDVGLYRFSDFTAAMLVLVIELWTALATMLLTVTTASAYMRRKHMTRFVLFSRITMLVIIWAGWGYFVLFLIERRKAADFIDPVTDFIAVFVLVLISIPLGLMVVSELAHNFRYLWWRIVLVALSTGLLFLLPFLLWTQGTIPRYLTATVFSLVLVGMGLYGGSRYLQKHLPVLPRKKRKRTKAKNAELPPRERKCKNDAIEGDE